MIEYLVNIPERDSIEKLENLFSKNQETMEDNFASPADQYERNYSKIERKGKDEGNMLEAKVQYYSNLNELYENGTKILNISILRYKSSIDVDLHSIDTFIKGIEKINNYANDLFRKRAKILYEEEIGILIDISDYEIQRSILFPKFQTKNLADLYPKKLIASNQLISNTKDSGLNLIEYHNSNLLKLYKRYSDHNLKCSNLKTLVQYIKENSIKCFEKYVIRRISTTTTLKRDQILKAVPVNYIVSFKNSLDSYIQNMKKYAMEHSEDLITKKQFANNNKKIENKHIQRVFDILQKEIYYEIDQISK